MGQQPNVEIGPAHRPRSTPEPGPARRWRPTRPGIVTSPEQMPWGGAFGTPGPDTGYAKKLIAEADLPPGPPLLPDVLLALMAARASSYGRAPVIEDLEVAMEILGLGEDPPAPLLDRRRRWLEAATHEQVPGRLALIEIDREILRAKPAEARRLLRLWAAGQSLPLPAHEDRPI
ncbi:MAG TPA: hypothetical protein VJR05_02610 [Acidimicrobiia bacterium]|nr:hypothetical protein [Acidimicrobiia bacterium]